MRAFDGRWQQAPAIDGNLATDVANLEQSQPLRPEDQLSDDDRAFIRRIGPPAAE
jgi:hypothetical protein